MSVIVPLNEWFCMVASLICSFQYVKLSLLISTTQAVYSKRYNLMTQSVS